ncbi:MAG: glycosyl hydrolase, partial [Verrucomicrobia bacterium]|nr:glycosyl hydrolase [Prolixibacteraceae bacterium]
MKISLSLILIVLFFFSASAKPKEYDLKSFPKGQTPQEIGTRIAEKFLHTAHSRYGNTRPDTKPTQIT